MGELKSSFSRDDIETLIDAMTDWESIGNHEYHVMQMVKGHPLPEQDDDSFEFVKKIKEHFRKREKEIKSERMLRQEKAILVKAKLVLLRQEGGINKLFEVAAEAAEEAAPQEEPSSSEGRVTKLSAVQQNRLELAEFYIKDLGVWDMYQKFLVDRGVTTPATAEKQEPEENDDDEWFHRDDSESN